MTDVRAFKALSLLTTIGVFAVAACTIQLRGGEESPPPLKAGQTAGETNSDLARCRSVTSVDTADYQRCKRVWDENRRRFFGKKDGAVAPGHDDSAAGVALVPKDQSRIPQGYPNLAAPEASKP
ncbi:putative entry exclusion protein TrbK-alt [Bradyrhizobium sp. CW7]|uniref:putative entry exclusion protein TrbK-alt n=1 Tax=Bradyrhizobium sp. CW7 TaxID=2782688 RepID=UPI001FF75891|nr:putative entry exclusion protein TrbK-alt [Bradyrhizobium sp. CW7]MCK1356285.1 putative entry exclusion protein TrbK-alt [Bradyrhizobium sp. CW7]